MADKNIPDLEVQIEELNKFPYTQRLKEIITVPCSMCGEPIELKYKSWKSLVGKGRIPKCRKCLGNDTKERYASLPDEEKAKRSEKLRVAATTQWATMDQEARRKQTANAVTAMKEFRDNATDEEKAAIREKQSVSHKSFFANLSEEEKQKRLEPMREGAKKFYESLDPEEKKRRLKVMEEGKQKWWANATADEKARLKEIRSQASKKYWREVNKGKVPISDRRMIQKWWSVMNPVEFFAYTGDDITPDDLDEIVLSPIEKEFSDLLKKKNIPYYPKRPNLVLIENERKHPFHVWSFAITKGDKINSIYIDIDDSLHNPDKHPMQVIIDEDSRRITRHDNKPGYIIEAYDDIITPMTPVQKIGDRKKITVKELLDILPPRA